ncbi:MAG TPA: hypothetical protein VLB32_07610 [Candidatus Acidoferrales bacterium]|nr:hypothetical protein [Candidatus Acidoferrales bacterium]
MGAISGAATQTAQRWKSDRWFFGGMGVAAAITVFVGFAPTYFLKDMLGGPPLTPLRHVHGFLFTSWIVLLIAQTSLIAVRRTDVHRRLGVAGGVLATAMVIVGTTLAVEVVRRGTAPPGLGSPLAFFAVPLFDMLMFAGLAGCGLYYRRQPETHKRLMLLATIAILGAAIARWPYVAGTGPLVFFGLTDLFIFAGWLYDFKTRGKVHPAFLWGGLALIASQPLRLAIAGTDAWLAFAGWVAR